MSLFKAKEWWSSGTIFPEESADMFHNGCIKLSQLGVEGTGDHVIIGNPNGLVQIFRPFGAYQPTHVTLECLMSFPILQMETGKFVFGSDIEYIGILYPNSFVVYSLLSNEGQAEFGNQNVLLEQYHHNLPAPAVCLAVGGFGGVRDKDFVCVQCLGGLLIFFEQDVATFSCTLPECLLPGPLVYSQCTDSFVLFSSTWTIDSYSYHNLSQLSEKNKNKITYSKKVVPDWTYKIGDTIRAMQKVQTSTNSCSLIMISDRVLYCLSDNGTVSFMKKFDFDIICSHAYLVGWCYDPNCRLITMIISETSTLLIYEHTTLLWSCQLTFLPIAINRGFFSYLPGSIVAVSESGEVKCLYLGTEPELFTAPPIIEAEVNYEKIQEELESIQSVINNQNDIGEIALINKAAEREVPFTISVSKNFEANNFDHNISTEDQQIELSGRLLKCKVNVKINPINKEEIDVIKVAFIVHHPFKCSNSNQTFHNFTEELLVETEVYLVDNSVVSKSDLHLIIVHISNAGNVCVLRKDLNLPFGLFARPVRPVKEAKCKITLNVDKSQIELIDLFKDFDNTLFTEVGSTNNVIAFESLNFSNDVVTIISAKSTQRYRIQSDGLFLMNIVLLEIVERFRKYFKRKSLSPVNDNHIFEIAVQGGISTEIIQHFVKTIERHLRLREKLFDAEKSLDVLSLQFILIQKRLMVKYREKPPTSCDEVHYLLLDTYHRIDSTCKDIITLKKDVLHCGQELCGCVNLICSLLSLLDSTDEDLKFVQRALSPDIMEHDQQNWEETVSVNVTTLLKNRFAKNDKEKDKIIPFNDTDNIKQFDGQKFVKYVQLILERALSKHNKSDGGVHSDALTLHRTSSSDSQQLDTVEEEKGSSNLDNVLEVPHGSMLGFHKKSTIISISQDNQENV